jgi:hypothetical protein
MQKKGSGQRLLQPGPVLPADLGAGRGYGRWHTGSRLRPRGRDQPPGLAGRATAILTAAVDKVKVQFTLGKLSETQQRRAACLQRAGATRQTVATAAARVFPPLDADRQTGQMHATIKRADGSACLLEASLLDISGGGVGLMAPQSGCAAAARHHLSDCKISLPDEGLLVANSVRTQQTGLDDQRWVPLRSRRLRVHCLARCQDEHAATLHQPHRTRAQGPTERHGLERSARGSELLPPAAGRRTEKTSATTTRPPWQLT